MSEWIDFALYTCQIVLLWVLLPRQSVRYTVPAILDRDPEWPAKHPTAMQCLLRSRAALNAFYVYAAFSVTLLLAVRLGLRIPALDGRQTPSWELLKDTHGTLLIVGLVMYFGSFFLWRRWLAVHVPLAPRRSASLTPRVASNYLPRSWQLTIEVLTAAHIALWLAAGVLGWAGGLKFWVSFAFIVGMTVLFAAIAYVVPRRRPGYLDRLFGDAYRQVEIRIACFMRLWPLAAGLIGLAERTTGVDLARAGHLLIVSFVCMLALMLLRLRPVAPPSQRFDADPRLSA